MARGTDRGRVRPTMTTTMSHNMAAILQLILSPGLQRMSLIFDIHVVVNWHLSQQSSCWPVSRDHIAGSSLHFIEVMFTADEVLVFDWIAGSIVRLICYNQGRIVRKSVNTNPGLKVNWIIPFSSIQMFFCCFVLCIWWLLNSKQKAKQ